MVKMKRVVLLTMIVLILSACSKMIAHPVAPQGTAHRIIMRKRSRYGDLMNLRQARMVFIIGWEILTVLLLWRKSIILTRKHMSSIRCAVNRNANIMMRAAQQFLDGQNTGEVYGTMQISCILSRIAADIHGYTEWTQTEVIEKSCLK